jgi:hypothetical protein
MIVPPEDQRPRQWLGSRLVTRTGISVRKFTCPVFDLCFSSFALKFTDEEGFDRVNGLFKNEFLFPGFPPYPGSENSTGWIVYNFSYQRQAGKRW